MSGRCGVGVSGCVGVRRGVLGFGEVCQGVSGRCVGEGMMLEGWRAGGRELAPLYYPDTLVNQDTCLGRFFFVK